MTHVLEVNARTLQEKAAREAGIQLRIVSCYICNEKKHIETGATCDKCREFYKQ